MKEAEVRQMLNNARNYSTMIMSLKREFEARKGTGMEDIIKSDLDRCTEHVMAARVYISKISNTKVQNVMRLRYINGMSFTLIADKLQITYQWVFQLHKRGIAELAKLIK